MPNHASLRRKIVLCLLLITVLAVPWASAAGRTAPGPPDLLARAWSFLTGLWSKTGCNIDPNGRCLPETPVVQPDEGCHIDPSGRCGPETPVVQPDEGCNIDPFGRCGTS